jgi:hypothetical protein
MLYKLYVLNNKNKGYTNIRVNNIRSLVRRVFINPLAS